MKIIYPTLKFVFKKLFYLLYRHKIYGTENIPSGAAIIAPNHISYLDPPIIAISIPDEVYFLARQSLFRFPLGLLIRRLNALPVSGKASDVTTIKTVCNQLASNKKMIIFPEGIRTHDGELTHVKPGLALISTKANVPIVPTLIHGTFEIWPRDQIFPRPWGETFCAFGPPVDPRQFQHLPKKEAQVAIAEEVTCGIQTLRKIYLKE